MLRVFFGPKVWGDADKSWVAQTQSWCEACQRVHQRKRMGLMRRGKPYEQQRRMSRQERIEARRKRHAERMRTDPEYRERRREIGREIATFIRRDRGAAVRGPYGPRRGKTTPKTKVAAEPFVAWLEWWLLTLPEVAETQSTEPTDSNWKMVRGELVRYRPTHSMAEIASWGGITDRQLRRITSGEQRTISFSVVDAILTMAGYHDQVAVLYPTLKGDTSATPLIGEVI